MLLGRGGAPAASSGSANSADLCDLKTCLHNVKFRGGFPFPISFCALGTNLFPLFQGDDFPDVTPDPDLCTPNSSITLSLLAVDSTTGYIQHHQRALPGGATVYIQLKETDSETVIKVSS